MIKTDHLTLSPNYVTLVSDNVVNLIDKQEPPKDLCITFDPSETIKALDDPLYISVRIKGIPSLEVIIDPICMVNVIIEEFLYSLQLHQVVYDDTDVVVKVFDGFPIGK